MSLKNSERRKNDLLCKLQLNLPTLQKEKSTLLAERASIDKQFEQEKRKNRELVGRLTRLNQQFYRLGEFVRVRKLTGRRTNGFLLRKKSCLYIRNRNAYNELNFVQITCIYASFFFNINIISSTNQTIEG